MGPGRVFRPEQFVRTKCSSWNNLYVQNAPVGTQLTFYRNTVEIAENSENHLKAIVCRRQMAGGDGVRDRSGKVVEKPQGEGKAAKNGERGWQSRSPSANYMDLRALVLFSLGLLICDAEIRGMWRNSEVYAASCPPFENREGWGSLARTSPPSADWAGRASICMLTQ